MAKTRKDGSFQPGRYRGLFDLTGRVALVTGGAGELGKRFAEGLADFGAKVAVLDLDEEAAIRTAATIERSRQIDSIGVSCDVSDPESVDQAVSLVEQRLGATDILINNAASKGPSLDAFFAPTEEFSLETWRSIMKTNLDGMFLVARAVGSRMAKRTGGSIVQTASIYGVVGPDQRIYEGSLYMDRPINTPPVYSASKAGVIGLTRHLATYWAEAGVRVNSLTPGGVASGQNDEFHRRYSARVPLGRMAEPDEIVGAVIFLASDAASYVTGHNLVVDGGLTAW